MENRSAKAKLYRIIYIVIYLIVINFSLPGYVLIKSENELVRQNITFFLYGSCFLLVMVLFRAELITAVKKVTVKQLDWVCCVGLVTLLAEILVGIALPYFLHTENIHQQNVERLKDFESPGLLFLTIVFLAPIVEEFFFRYCIISFTSKYKMISCVFSVFLFAFAHVWEYVILMGDGTQILSMLPYAALATGLAVVYAKTQNICYPILLHMLNNLIGQLG